MQKDIPAWAERILQMLSERPGKTRAGIAAACGIKPGSISGWFGAGKPTKMISGDNLVATARYLEVSPEWIMTGREPARLSQSQPVEMDLDMLQAAIVAAKEAFRAFGREMEAFDASPLIAFAYQERAKMPRMLSKDQLKKFDETIIAKLRGDLGYVEGERVAGSGAKGADVGQANRKTVRGRGS